MDINSFVMGIAAGKKSAGGGGSSGGALPAGCYWEQKEPLLPYSYSNVFFNFEDKLYVNVKTASSSDTYTIYEATDEGYVAVVSGINLIYGGSCPIEYNGKIHFFGNGHHYVLNGTTVTKLNDTTWNGNSVSLYDYNIFVEDGNLYFWYSTYNTLNQWDEATDTWTDTKIVPNSSFASYATGYVFFYNNELYRADGKILYKYENGSGVQVATFPESINNATCKRIDNWLYFCSNTAIYKHNLDSGETIEMGLKPDFSSSNNVYVYNGIYHLTNGGNKRNNFALHEIE